MLLALTAFMAVVLVLVACSPSGSTGASTTTGVDGATIRLREGPAPPVGCEPEVVARIISTTLDAISKGDQQRLDRAFSDFPIFSVDSRPRGTFFRLSGGKQELVAYFAERHRLGETARLVRLDVGYTSGRAQFGLSLARQAADVDGLAPGKGELDCSSMRIDIWNIGPTAQ